MTATALLACYPDFEFTQKVRRPCGEGPPCSGADKCTVIDEATGERSCAPAGPRPDWSRCEEDSQCQSGLWCDHSSETCKPTCEDNSDCGGDRYCVPALTATDQVIPTLSVCLAICHPIEITPCHDTHGVTNCVHRYDLLNQFDCMASGGGPEGSTCEESKDCAAGLSCVRFGLDPVCARWCTPPNGDSCSGGGTCFGLQSEPQHNGIEYGVCDPG